MLALALALALTQTPQHRLFKQPNLGSGVSYAFFEAFSGAGTTTACSTTAPTGARGEVLTFTRTGSATCTRTATGGLATTGIADGDLVSLSGNVARVEYDSAGVLGLLVESARTNVLLQSATISNAVYSDVATPTLTGSQTDPFGTTTAVQVDDNDGTAYEGRQQTVTVTAATAYIMSCFIKAGTTDKARLSLDGTGCNVSGLSATTWTRASCADASSSGAAIVAQVLVGNATSDTGTVIYGGCQVEAGTYMTSYQPAGAASAVRNAEQAEFALTSHTLSAPFSFAATASLPSGLPTNARAHGTVGPSGLATYVDSYLSAGTWVADSTQVTPNAYITAQSTTAGSTVRAATYHDGTNFAGCLNSSCSTVARAWSNLASVVVLRVGQYSSAAGPIDGIQTRVCYQPGDFTRCR